MILVVASGLLLASVSNNAEVEPRDPRYEAMPLDGDWAGGCIAMGKHGRHGSIARLTVHDGHFEAAVQTYAHATCDTPTITTRLTGEIIDVEGGRTLKAVISVDDVTLRPDHADVVAIWNAHTGPQTCGDQPWRLGKAQSTAGEACVSDKRFPERGARLAVEASRDGDTLGIANPMIGSDATGDLPTITLNRSR